MSHGDSMKTVLLTGAGGPAISGMIAVIKGCGYRVIAVDMSDFSSGFYLADKAYVVPPGNSINFLIELQKICEIEHVDAVISVVDEELSKVSSLEQLGIKVLQPRLPFINFCLDKLYCMQSLHKVGLSVPETWLVSNLPQDVCYPLFIKPRVGRGSRGCGRVDSMEQLSNFLRESSYLPNQLIAQKCISGEEYTVSVVAWRDGNVQAVVPKKIVSKIGVTKIAITKINKNIENLCIKIQNEYKADGPFNVQLIVDEHGIPWAFEINPRFSTSTTLTKAAGIDEVGGLLAQAFFGKSEHSFGDWKENIVLVRQTVDHFISEAEFYARRAKYINV